MIPQGSIEIKHSGEKNGIGSTRTITTLPKKMVEVLIKFDVLKKSYTFKWFKPFFGGLPLDYYKCTISVTESKGKNAQSRVTITGLVNWKGPKGKSKNPQAPWEARGSYHDMMVTIYKSWIKAAVKISKAAMEEDGKQVKATSTDIGG